VDLPTGGPRGAHGAWQPPKPTQDEPPAHPRAPEPWGGVWRPRL